MLSVRESHEGSAVEADAVGWPDSWAAASLPAEQQIQRQQECPVRPVGWWAELQ